MLKSVNKFKATRLTFAIQQVTLNEEKISNILDSFNIKKTEAAIAEKPKTPAKKNKKQKN